jgi:TatA/E family protein of Tat protein translocase
VLIFALLFGAKRLPDSARQLGRSMRIFKSEMKELKADDAVDTKKNDDSSEK